MKLAEGKILVRVWDLPTRLFHWLLAAAIAAAYITGETGGGWLIWHGRLGLFIVGLVAFRLIWGLLGSTHSRFASFFPTPARIRAYLSGQWRGLGHNPLGALSVFGLLALVILQAGTGLVSYNDDIGYEGYLYRLIPGSVGDLTTRFHHKLFDFLAMLVGLHVAAITFYVRIKKDNLVKPMIFGHKEVDLKETSDDPATRGGGIAALVVAAAIAVAVVWAASGAWIEKPAPAAIPAPAW